MTKKLNGVLKDTAPHMEHGQRRVLGMKLHTQKPPWETRPFPPYLYSAIASVVPKIFIVGKEIREVTK
jgi:hypothetical protein